MPDCVRSLHHGMQFYSLSRKAWWRGCELGCWGRQHDNHTANAAHSTFASRFCL